MIMIAGMGEMTPNWLWRQCMICLVFCKDCCQLSGKPPVKSGIPYTTWLRSAHEMWLLFHFKVCFVDFNVNHTYIIMWATTQANCRLCFCYYYTITIPNNIYIYTLQLLQFYLFYATYIPSYIWTAFGPPKTVRVATSTWVTCCNGVGTLATTPHGTIIPMLGIQAAWRFFIHALRWLKNRIN